jgi:4-alpha-glucanotransferase
MTLERAAGILVHVTSLPGPFGIGEMGPETGRFLDWVSEAGLKLWQVLPLGPAGLNGSPYNSPSAFAGNPLLISPGMLVDAGWLSAASIAHPPRFDENRVRFAQVAEWKRGLLRRSWSHFQKFATRQSLHELEAFVEGSEQGPWLEDWALYASLKRLFKGRPWMEWEPELRKRDPSALGVAARKLSEELAFERYLQFLFFRQWEALKREAHIRGLSLIGDVPFYVAPDSADIWANQDLFQVDEEGRPTKVGGVPPDYFSKDGQLWGNPLFRWDRIAERGYDWWIERIRCNLRLVDRLRLDHFRGFLAYWEVQAGEKTAVGGRWVPGPGRRLFDALRERLGDLPLIAEDLGVITEDVVRLRDELSLPGMRVLQFAYDDPGSTHLPENHSPNSVAYTGTHDNDTLRGWLEGLEERQRRALIDRLGGDPANVVWKMIEATFGSPAVLALVPLQDLLGLGGEARMNRPGVTRGNWRWRARKSLFTLELASRLRRLTAATGR